MRRVQKSKFKGKTIYRAKQNRLKNQCLFRESSTPIVLLYMEKDKGLSGLFFALESRTFAKQCIILRGCRFRRLTETGG